MKTNNLIGLCVHVPTEEAFKQVCTIASENGFNTLPLTMYNKYRENTCIYFLFHGDLSFSDKLYYEGKGTSVLSVEDLEAIVVLDITPPTLPSIII